MGMTDKQFNSYIRLILAALKDIFREQDPELREQKQKELLDNLQTTLED